MLTKQAFAQGMKRVELRFDKKLKMEALEEYYEFLKYKLTDDQMEAASKRVFAEASRYPRPADFIEAAPPPEVKYQGEREDNPFVPVRIPILAGSKAHRTWLRTCEERDRAGIHIPSHNRDGFPAPVVVVLSPDEWEAELHRKRIKAI